MGECTALYTQIYPELQMEGVEIGSIEGCHTCQVLGKSKSEIARAPMIFAYNLVIERSEKSGAQVLRVRFFSLFKLT